MNKIVCVACKRQIDEAARVCPYCGADPVSGQKLDTQALLQEVFQPRRLSKSESILEYARHRQGIFIAAGVVAAFLILAALHQFVTVRNNSDVTADPAVPLTEVADLSNQPEETKALPMPELKFQYDGQPKRMRTFIMEPGAVTPPVAPPPPPPAAQGSTAAPQTQP